MTTDLISVMVYCAGIKFWMISRGFKMKSSYLKNLLSNMLIVYRRKKVYEAGVSRGYIPLSKQVEDPELCFFVVTVSKRGLSHEEKCVQLFT